MNQTTFSIITGVAGGILTTVLLYLARRLWIGVVYPAWENAIYKDTKIEGKWEANIFAVAFDPTRIRELISNTKNKERIRFISILKAINEEMAKKVKEKELPEDTRVDKPQEKAERADDKNGKEKKQEAAQAVSSIDTENPHEIESFTITLNRTGHQVNGYMLGTVGSNKGRNYKICGSFRNLILTATLESESPNCIERGALCLSLRNNGATFEGYIATYSDNSHHIAALKTVWNRSA
ncbi:hypothetical protein [Rivihabitans pingtungensis]|uniref:hypothetical protein n=1 Tax=Rivihabitans pingtungensis TaxID=1054498 RepID=UPI0023539484|nr:hypothetical protein [Rivihabitans pingtungensis]MCK6437914.1 hypothetical protein [Rivihabitans pingtungensis]